MPKRQKRKAKKTIKSNSPLLLPNQDEKTECARVLAAKGNNRFSVVPILHEKNWNAETNINKKKQFELICELKSSLKNNWRKRVNTEDIVLIQQENYSNKNQHHVYTIIEVYKKSDLKKLKTHGVLKNPISQKNKYDIIIGNTNNDNTDNDQDVLDLINNI